MAGKFFVRLTTAYNETNKICNFYMYYNKNIPKTCNVGQPSVGQTVKTSIRFAGRNYKKITDRVNYINYLSSEMQTDFSKTLNNILDDYFLDEELELHKYELEDIDK